MEKIKDETLMAYVDDQLGADERKQVEIALSDDPQARSKVEELRKTRTAIDRFAEILDEPVPDHLIKTIRRHEQGPEVIRLPERPRRNSWFLLAASLVVGVSLGAIGTKYFLSRSHRIEVATAASDMAELSTSLNAANKKTITTQAKLADISKALEIALAEKKKAKKQVVAAITTAKNLPFPLSLVSRAVENGSRLTAKDQKIIVAQLNTAPALTSTASGFSRLSAKSAPVAGAANMSSLNDLQPTAPPGKNKYSVNARNVTPAKINNILGEFSYAGKTCRLFRYAPRPSSETLVLVACKEGTGVWEIIQKNFQ